MPISIGRDVHTGVNEGVKRFFYLASGIDNSSYFGHAVGACIESGGLNIKGHHFVVHIPVAAAMHGETAVHIVYKIALTAVDYLNAVLPSGLPHIRKCLKNSVVGHGYCLVTPGNSGFNERFHVRHCVHRAHLGVHMQLYPLVVGGVHSHL